MPLARADVRDVCFAHWPVDADVLAARLPRALTPATRDGTAWVSILAQRTRAGLRGVPGRFEFPQVTLRTYVVPKEGGERESTPDVGVSFLHVETDSRLVACGARLTFGVPYHHAGVRHRSGPDGFEVTIDDPDGTRSFDAEVEPRDDAAVAEPGSLVRWVTERYGYYLPDGRRGETAHEPWPLHEVEGSVAAAGLFERAGLPAPDADPVLRYSPGVDVRLTRRP